VRYKTAAKAERAAKKYGLVILPCLHCSGSHLTKPDHNREFKVIDGKRSAW
jgi:hypothetical protein